MLLLFVHLFLEHAKVKGLQAHEKKVLEPVEISTAPIENANSNESRSGNS